MTAPVDAAPDLTAAADVLGRAANRLEEVTAAAIGNSERNTDTPWWTPGGLLDAGHDPEDADFMALLSPAAMAALVSALRAANLIAHFSKSIPCADCADQPDPDCKHADLCALVGPLAEFARRVPRKEGPVADRLAQDWRTRPVAREVTVVTAYAGAKPVVTVVLCADGSVRVEHQLPEPVTVRVDRDGPDGYHTESRTATPYGAVALLQEEETGG